MLSTRSCSDNSQAAFLSLIKLARGASSLITSIVVPLLLLSYC